MSSLLFRVIREIADDHAHEGHDDHAGHSDHADHGHHDEHGHEEHGHDEHGHDDHSDHAEGTFCSGSACLRNWKIGFAVLLFVEGVIFGYFALLLKKFACVQTKRFRKFLGFINIGGGGIFLASGFLHILPEGLEFLAPAEEGGHDDHGHDDHHDHAHGFPTGMTVVLYSFLAFMLLEMFLIPHHDEHESPSHTDDEAVEKGGEAEEKEVSKANGLKSKAFASMSLITAAIGIHSIFESIALGASSRWSSTLNLFIAIGTHRWATTMSLGARYAKVNLSGFGYALCVIGYALIAPIGVAIGMAVQGNASNRLIGVVFAISGGIFFYIGGFETPVEELVGKQENKFIKYLTYLAGATVITIITGILSATGVH